MSQQYFLEICVDSFESAKAAIEGGADRLEVCARLDLDGLTPSKTLVKQIKEISSIPQYIMIRPRAGDFHYTDIEFDTIRKQMIEFSSLDIQGFVSGALTQDKRVDVNNTTRLIEWAGPKPFTFHRAFDLIRDQKKALELLIQIGVCTVLTSGGEPKAEQGVEQIKDLVEQAKGRIQILAGSGINESNVGKLIKATGVCQVHSSASKLHIRNERLVKKTNKEMVLRIVKEMKLLNRPT